MGVTMIGGEWGSAWLDVRLWLFPLLFCVGKSSPRNERLVVRAGVVVGLFLPRRPVVELSVRSAGLAVASSPRVSQTSCMHQEHGSTPELMENLTAWKLFWTGYTARRALH